MCASCALPLRCRAAVLTLFPLCAASIDSESVYIGGSDEGHEGNWQWRDGPDAGVSFWNSGPVSGKVRRTFAAPIRSLRLTVVWMRARAQLCPWRVPDEPNNLYGNENCLGADRIGVHGWIDFRETRPA